MARVEWTDALLDKALDLRVNHDKSYAEIADILGFETADGPRLKVARVLRAQSHPVPERGRIAYTAREQHAGAPSPLDEGDRDGRPVVDLQMAAHPVPPRKLKATWTVENVGGPEHAPGDLTPDVLEEVRDEVAEQLPYELHGKSLGAKYKFDGKVFTFSVNNLLVDITRARWSDIIADYSEHGGNLTQQEIALKQGMNIGVLRAMLHLYGAYKASPPVLREDLADTPEPELAPLYDRAIEVKAARFLRGLDRHKLKTLEQTNHALREQLAAHQAQDARARALLREVIDTFPTAAPLERLDFGQTPGAEEVHACVWDAHFGANLQAEDGGWGGTFNTDIAAAYLLAYVDRIALAVSARPHRCTTIHLTLGGDLFNAFDQHTKGGTLLERDRYDRVVWRIAFEAVTTGIQRLAEVTDRVVVRVIRGNHDGVYAELFEEQLAAFYRTEPRVEVPNQLGKRKAWLVGQTLHVIDHGEGFESLGPKQLLNAETVAREVGGPLFFRARKVYLYVGHTHHRERVALDKQHGAHLEVVRLPTWAHTTDYEERLAIAGEPEGVFYFLDAQGRLAGEERVFFSDLYTGL